MARFYHWQKEGCRCTANRHGNRHHNWRCPVHGGWRTIDWSKPIAAVIVFGTMAIIIGGIVYIRAAAPCKYIDWMPVKDVPARCLKVGHR